MTWEISWVTSLFLLSQLPFEGKEICSTEQASSAASAHVCFESLTLGERSLSPCHNPVVTLWYLMGSTFNDSTQVSSDSKQTTYCFLCHGENEITPWRDLQHTMAVNGSSACLTARHHPAWARIKLASLINHLHNEVPAAALWNICLCLFLIMTWLFWSPSAYLSSTLPDMEFYAKSLESKKWQCRNISFVLAHKVVGKLSLSRGHLYGYYLSLIITFYNQNFVKG